MPKESDDDHISQGDETFDKQNRSIEMHGSTATSALNVHVEDPIKDVEKALEMMLAESIDVKTSADAYKEALEKAPLLVKTESDPMRFLRHAGGDAGEAARRIIKYWRERRKIFGSERAFMPVALVNDNSQGALGVPDIEILQSGFICPLPGIEKEDSEDDERTTLPVFCVDADKLSTARSSYSETEDIPNEALVRCVFYWLQYASEIENVQTEGLVCLRVISDKPMESPERNRLALICTVLNLLQIFPIRIKAVYYCMNTNDREKRSFLHAVSGSFMKPVFSVLNKLNHGAYSEQLDRLQAFLHVEHSAEDLCRALESHGFIKSGLPYSLGGSWRYDNDETRHLPLKKRGSGGGSPVQQGGGFMLELEMNGMCKWADAHCENKRNVSEHGRQSKARVEKARKPASRGADARQDSGESPSSSPVSSTSDDSAASGRKVAARESDTIRRQALRQLSAALDVLPEIEKAAYVEALSRAPRLIKSDLDPMSFLLYENFNVWSAARRIAFYWRSRKDVFGQRAFLPMSQTDHGALEKNDLAVIRSRMVELLPQDRQGRPVICFDASKIARIRSSKVPFGGFNKVVFYLLTALCEKEVACKEGFVALFLVDRDAGVDGLGIAIDSICKIADMVITAFPTRVKYFHIVHDPERNPTQLVAPVEMEQLRSALKLSKIVQHTGSSKQDIFASLKKYGFEASALPPICGGLWSSDDSENWHNRRISFELFKCAETVMDATESAAHSPGSDSKSLGDGDRKVNNDDARSYSKRVGSIQAESKEDIFEGVRFVRPASLHALREDVTSMTNLSLPSAQPANHDVVSWNIQSQTIDRQMLADLEASIAILPTNQKAAYLEAKERCPTLISSESNSEKYLRLAMFNTNTAARHLTLYWTRRREVFGDKAFLPMTQTGEGALTRSDISLLSSGYLMQLPNDSMNRSVVCLDLDRLGKSTSDSRLRVAFYIFSIAAENICSQESGVVVLCAADRPRRDQKNLSLKNVLDALPLKISVIRYLRLETKPGARKPRGGNSNEQFRAQFGDLGQVNAVDHLEKSRDTLANLLIKCGHSLSGLPKSLGGEWGVEQFVQWQELRTRFEWQLPAGSSGTEVAKMFDFSSIKPLAQLNDEEKTERKRRMNVIHSRRKRERERVEVEVLEERCADLGHRNGILTTHNEELEEMVARAKEIVARERKGRTESEVRSSPSVQDFQDLKPAPAKRKRETSDTSEKDRAGKRQPSQQRRSQQHAATPMQDAVPVAATRKQPPSQLQQPPAQLPEPLSTPSEAVTIQQGSRMPSVPPALAQQLQQILGRPPTHQDILQLRHLQHEEQQRQLQQQLQHEEQQRLIQLQQEERRQAMGHQVAAAREQERQQAMRNNRIREESLTQHFLLQEYQRREEAKAMLEQLAQTQRQQQLSLQRARQHQGVAAGLGPRIPYPSIAELQLNLAAGDTRHVSGTAQISSQQQQYQNFGLDFHRPLGGVSIPDSAVGLLSATVGEPGSTQSMMNLRPSGDPMDASLRKQSIRGPAPSLNRVADSGTVSSRLSRVADSRRGSSCGTE